MAAARGAAEPGPSDDVLVDWVEVRCSACGQQHHRTRRGTAMMGRLQIWLGVGLMVLVSGPVLADGDAVAGKKVFNKCKACHVADAETNRVGPYLKGVIGRPAGTVEGFKYSTAMKDSGIVWDEATIAEYIVNPKAYVPGNKMAFPGLKKEADIANLIAYLEEANQ
jgi:cytochrome c